MKSRSSKILYKIFRYIFTSMALLIGKIVWGSEKPRVISEKQMHNSVSLFGADFGQEAQYFFENEAGQAAIINVCSISRHIS